MGWPLSCSTKAAASRALYFLAEVDSAGGLAFGFFFAAGVGVAGTRFFFAVMAGLLGRQLASRGGAPVAPPRQGRMTTSTAPPPPGNSRQNREDFRPARRET